jgi:MFS transporter, putative metabolite:H+ symporter
MSRLLMTLKGRATIYHLIAFWLGTEFIVMGVGFHLPDFIAARKMHYCMQCMPMSKLMLCGMGLILTGIPMAAYGLFPVRSGAEKNLNSTYQLHTLDNAQLSWRHLRLVIVLAIALVVDVMKPATLGFVMPGMAKEYGISASTASLLALFAMIGTTAGSVLWGIMGDKLGRRGAILLASLMFISTGICGTMPAFKWNLFMCFFYGDIRRRSLAHRFRIAGRDVAGAASGLASGFDGWRGQRGRIFGSQRRRCVARAHL